MNINDKLIFVSSNEYKINEVKQQFTKYNIEIIPKKLEIKELQEACSFELIKDKVLKCFNIIKYDFIVEHTELRIESLNNFPGMHTAPFWKTLKSKKICEISKNSKATAITYLGFCNGRRIEIFRGVTTGKISNRPKGNSDFQWDTIFIPDGSNKTFAELGKNKDRYSMREKAIKKFMEYYERNERNNRIKEEN